MGGIYAVEILQVIFIGIIPGGEIRQVVIISSGNISGVEVL